MLENRPYAKLFCKVAVGLGTLAACTLTTLYFAQDKILYLPRLPIQYPEQNQYGYRHPGERGMLYRNIETRTKDNILLKGWFMM